MAIAVNEPEWGGSDLVDDSDHSMEIGRERIREKRTTNFATMIAKKVRSSWSFGIGTEERAREGPEFKILLR